MAGLKEAMLDEQAVERGDEGRANSRLEFTALKGSVDGRLYQIDWPVVSRYDRLLGEGGWIRWRGQDEGCL